MVTGLLKHLRPLEVFIVISIVGLLALTWAVTTAQTTKTTRDTQRKSDLTNFYQAAESFRNDYGFYPNYTMILGLSTSDRSKSHNYDLASVIGLCPNLDKFVAGVDLKKPQSNLNKAYLKPGYQAVSNFLVCLGYLGEVTDDPLWAGTVSDYQYRVSSDYQEVLIVGNLERINDSDLQALENNVGWKYYLGNGVNDRNLFDSSDYSIAGDQKYFQAFEGREIENSSYLYQCLKNAAGKLLSVNDRANDKYQPFTLAQDTGEQIANFSCRDHPDGLLVVASR
ncbi:MAG: hypothetical protein WEC81_01755 [Patescibacteria group bacterium]